MGMPKFQPRNTSRARTLRNAATPAERVLWKHLSKRQVGGAKFSRQMPIGPYFVDFLCREKKLIIEIDGYSHDLTVAADGARTTFLEAQGFELIRFSNAEVLQQIEGVVLKIAQALKDRPAPSPSRMREGEMQAPLKSDDLPLAAGVKGRHDRGDSKP